MVAGRTIGEAFAEGIRREAPKTEQKLAEYRESEAFRSLPPHEQKQIGLIHWAVKRITEEAC